MTQHNLRIGSLCSGYGGLDMAVMDVLGGSMAWHCQYDPEDRHQYAARILEHHWPAVPNLGDVTAVDWSTVEPIDVLTAGFPCQPFSLAGRRDGAKDERWLWDDVAQAIRILRPSLVVLENVPGLLTAPGRQPDCVCGWDLRWGRHLGDLLHDHEWANQVLATDGRQDGQAPRAECALGDVRRPARSRPPEEARQRRDTPLGDVWRRCSVPVEAHAAVSQSEAGASRTRSGDAEPGLAGVRERPWDLVDARDLRGVGRSQDEAGGAERAGDGGTGRGDCPACGRPMDDPAKRPVRRAVGDVLRSLSDLGFASEWCTLRASDVGAPHRRERWFLLAWPVADTTHLGHERTGSARTGRPGPEDGDLSTAYAASVGWGEGRPESAGQFRGPDVALGGVPASAHTNGDAVRQQPVTELGGSRTPVAGLTGVEWGTYGPAVARWEHVLGRPAPSPVDDRGRLSPWFVEWMMGLPEGHVCDVPAPEGMSVAGVRNARLKALGNGVVPQQAAHALRMLLGRVSAEIAA